MNQHDWGQTESLPNHVFRVIIMVQDALDQHEIKTVISIGQVVCIANKKANWPPSLVFVGQFNCPYSGINSCQAAGFTSLPEVYSEVAIPTAQIEDGAIFKASCLKNHIYG